MAKKRIRNSPEYLEKCRNWAKLRYEKNKEEIIKTNTEYSSLKRSDEKHRIRRLVNAARLRSKLKNVPFDIDYDFLENLWDEQSGNCAISGREFDLNSSEERVNKNAPSLDRIEPKLGYVKGNVRLVTWQINAAISEYGFGNFIKICQDVIEFNKG